MLVIIAELTIIALAISTIWKHIIKPAIQNRTGDVKKESELEKQVREKNQQKYEETIK